MQDLYDTDSKNIWTTHGTAPEWKAADKGKTNDQYNRSVRNLNTYRILVTEITSLAKDVGKWLTICTYINNKNLTKYIKHVNLQ